MKRYHLAYHACKALKINFFHKKKDLTQLMTIAPCAGRMLIISVFIQELRLWLTGKPAPNRLSRNHVYIHCITTISITVSNSSSFICRYLSIRVFFSSICYYCCVVC